MRLNYGSYLKSSFTKAEDMKRILLQPCRVLGMYLRQSGLRDHTKSYMMLIQLCRLELEISWWGMICSISSFINAHALDKLNIFDTCQGYCCALYPLVDRAIWHFLLKTKPCRNSLFFFFLGFDIIILLRNFMRLSNLIIELISHCEHAAISIFSSQWTDC